MSNIQQELLKHYATDFSDEQLAAFKMLLDRYFTEKDTNENDHDRNLYPLDEIATFIATMNPEKVAALKASAPYQERLDHLLDKQSQPGLTEEEKKELEQYLVINRIFSLAKAKAIQNLLGRAQDEADRIREEKGLDSDELLKTHRRKPYRKIQP